jgi:putative FmdB family regulatory protein
MAIYEYDCPQCGTFEVTQKMSDPPLTVHGNCGFAVERRISLTSFSLKGAGWHADGYATPNARANAAAGLPPCGASAGACGTGACAAARS